MSDGSDQASEQARFAAREFVARFDRDMGEPSSAVVTDRMLFAYEMGYPRGRSDAAPEAMKMFDEISQAREEARKDSDDDTE
jgi:hypothetical protein